MKERTRTEDDTELTAPRRRLRPRDAAPEYQSGDGRPLLLEDLYGISVGFFPSDIDPVEYVRRLRDEVD